ncbi:MAG: division plane positioning ATPase MipZ [Candidatus Symbiobacter sp.]|nr:division plane positioning ATPase MipZ [Candidatus Symbiobacter sp.]
MPDNDSKIPAKLAPENHKILVLGNEKGGTGKSTTAMHLVVALMQEGLSVAVIDLDLRQGSLRKYLDNRRAFDAPRDLVLPMPTEYRVPSEASEDVAALQAAITELKSDHDVVLIDCPGSDSILSRAAHAMADILITPLNESFVDFAVLAEVDPENLAVGRASHYAEMVWEARKSRAEQRKPALEWYVMRNRISGTHSSNRENVLAALETLAKKIGFRLIPGLGDRMIFRELYPQGLTLLDLGPHLNINLTMAQVSGRQEVRNLLAALRFTHET